MSITINNIKIYQQEHGNVHTALSTPRFCSQAEGGNETSDK